jgi:uncharacterized protein (DUF2235 family)
VKRIVLCTDGTWAGPDPRRLGTAAPTNVVKMALMVRRHDDAGVDQVVFYQKGVGTGPRDRFSGGFLGAGISRHIKEAYRFLIDTYDAGDQIYLFGFSRGAYTARSLAGLIRNSGILRRDERHRLDEAFDLYRRRDDASKPTAVESRVFRRMYSCGDDPAVWFIGVWDTVGSLGIPNGIPWLPVTWLQYLNRKWQFHDTDLSSTVRYAFHALAVDERRAPFAPTLWTQRPDARGQTLEQVWFVGVHSDVGGGYRDRGLSDISLLWMVRRATQAGLALDLRALPSDLRPAPNPRGLLQDSRDGFPYRFVEAADRVIGQRRGPGRRRRRRHWWEVPPFSWISAGVSSVARLLGLMDPVPAADNKETGPTHETVHVSVIERRDSALDPRYKPANVADFLRRGGRIST